MAISSMNRSNSLMFIGKKKKKGKDVEQGLPAEGNPPVVSNSHAAVQDGRSIAPIAEEPEEEKPSAPAAEKHEKSVLQAKLTKLAIQIGYGGKKLRYI